MPVRNLFEEIPDALPEERIESLFAAPGVRLERIVSRGHSSAPHFWYDQQEDEWVAVLRGRARIAFDDGAPEVALEPGDHLLIAARRRHRVAWTDPEQDTIWLALFHRR